MPTAEPQNLSSKRLSPAQYAWLTDLVRRTSGLNLHLGKQELVKARLSKWLRKLRIDSYEEYLVRLRDDATGEELAALMDVLTTNQTFFFRERAQLGCLAAHVLPHCAGRRLRIWSAGCSTGEEPYSIAIALHEHLRGAEALDWKILGTDISRRCLEAALRGVYPEDKVAGVPPAYLTNHFEPVRDAMGARFRVKAHLRSKVDFARLNLMSSWPMKGPFDAIFCRNVMIYFEKSFQEELVNRLYGLLRPKGILVIGSAESLTNRAHRFEYLEPAIYRRP